MRAVRRSLNLILVFILAVSAIPLMSACSDAVSSGKYLVYYANADADDIVHREYIITDSPTKDVYTKVTEMFHQMYEVDYTDEMCFSPKPEDVKINDFVVSSDGLLSVDFSSEYIALTNVQEIILRSSLVLTIIQIEGISGVLITVNSEPVKGSDGNDIGIITSDSFVNIVINEAGMLKKETDVVLYFANADGTALVPVKSHFTISSNNTSIEEYILKQLIKGPAAETIAKPTMAADVELLSVTTTDYVCYVNFGTSFVEQEQPVSDEILIYSIVDSLCRLYYVNSVQFLIDGDVSSTIHGVTDLSKPFTPNRNLIMVPLEHQTEIQPEE